MKRGKEAATSSKVSYSIQVDLLDLECLHEAFSLGVVVWVAASTHRTMEAVLGELVAVIFGCILGRFK
jgi:hypothetical protein